jgi:thioredoxin 1
MRIRINHKQVPSRKIRPSLCISRDMEKDTVVTKITGQDFNEEVLKSALPVFACFTNSQCGSCFALCLIVEDLAKEYEGRLKFIMVDVEAEPELAAQYGIVPLPAVLLFKHSEPVAKLLGFEDKWSLRTRLDKLVQGR